jgi:hypothetical protein
VTRRDFEAMAQIVAESAMPSDEAERVAVKMAEHFASVNPRFDADRFFEAACVDGGAFTGPTP